MKYYTIAEMLGRIDEPNISACIKLYNDSEAAFKEAAGSSHNHQVWPGGYHDHIEEVMNICSLLYPVYQIRQLNFSLADVLLVMFLHDLEKPWRDKIIADMAACINCHGDGHYRVMKDGESSPGPLQRCGCGSYGKSFNKFYPKIKRKEFRLNKIKEYGIILNEQQSNALEYVEGEGESYSSKKRVMNELAAFCHIVDISSARIWHDYGRDKVW